MVSFIWIFGLFRYYQFLFFWFSHFFRKDELRICMFLNFGITYPRWQDTLLLRFRDSKIISVVVIVALKLMRIAVFVFWVTERNLNTVRHQHFPLNGYWNWFLSFFTLILRFFLRICERISILMHYQFPLYTWTRDFH